MLKYITEQTSTKTFKKEFTLILVVISRRNRIIETILFANIEISIISVIMNLSLIILGS